MSWSSRLVSAALVAFATLLSSYDAAAQPSNNDAGPTDASASPPAAPARKLSWHDTLVVWDNSVTTQTLGLGADYQSRNPTYEMMFRFAPRYYLRETPRQSISLRGDVRLIREFTNNDLTTERGEWTFSDADVSLALTQQVQKADSPRTQLLLRAPLLVLPTSKVSYAGGRILALGVGGGLDQEVLLRGRGARFLPGLLLEPRVSYAYQFVRAVVPVHDIDRVRLDPEGYSVPSDELNGSAFPQHLVSTALRIETVLTEQFSLTTDIGARYVYRYAFRDSEAIGGRTVLTGPVQISSNDGTRFGVQTLFAMSVNYDPLPFLEFNLGYLNFAPQIGSDGRRRSVFYSPDARVFFSVGMTLDGFYQELHGEPPARQEAIATARPRAL
jgi:hypothetical protein